MLLDVIIATYNRAESLNRALHSLLSAPVPDEMRRLITVVDNNSRDHTRTVVEHAARAAQGSVRYVFEPRQGQSYARNAAIATASGDLVAFVDDDEEVGPKWFEEIFRAFQEPDLDFAGGPYVAIWSVPPPPWLTKRVASILGSYDAGDEILPYGGDATGILPGGNCVFRRQLLQRVGPYSGVVGHKGGRPMGNDDTDMYLRILKAGARGVYLPGLVVYHHIPANRLTKRYARKLKFWGAVSQGLIDRMETPSLPRVAGVPRYLLGHLVREIHQGLKNLAALNYRNVFQHELEFWYVAGFVYGRLWFRDNGPAELDAFSAP